MKKFKTLAKPGFIWIIEGRYKYMKSIIKIPKCGLLNKVVISLKISKSFFYQQFFWLDFVPL
jgi:hypothetical protein